jgi:gliding motility-associated-like protein
MPFLLRLKWPILSLILLCQPLRAQFNLPSDTVLCPGENHYISSGFKSISSSTVVSLSDDQFSAVIPIGFPFEFYGVAYTELVISSNNYVTFNTGVAGGGSPWQINANIPNAGNAQPNSIMCPWQDINPGVGGTIEYGVSGNAPNRIFTISFCQIPMFSCTGDLFTDQILLYEGSFRIETHIRDKPLCVTWNNGAAIHGLQNASGTVAHVVPGRNFSDPVWTTTNEGYAFIPTASNGYTIQQIAYNPSVFNDIDWYDSSGNLFSTGDSLFVNLPQGTVETFRVQSSICGGAIISDTITLYLPDLQSAEIQPSCENEPNGIVFIDLFDQNPYRYNCFLVDVNDSIIWASSVQRFQDTAYGIPPGKYAVVVTDTNSCLQIDTVVVGSLGNVVAAALAVNDVYYDSVLVYQEFFDNSEGAVQHFWTSNGQTSTDVNPIFSYDTCGVYPVTLEVLNANGCRDSISFDYEVYCYIEPPVIPEDSTEFEVPNVFTPNGDGINDYFNISYQGLPNLVDFQGRIYTRFGQEVYSWTDWATKESGWNGTMNGNKVADGTYFYIITSKDSHGQSFNRQGTLTLFSGGTD